MKLNEFQHQFTTFVLASQHQLAPIPNALGEWLNSNCPDLSARLNVYRGNIFISLTEALKEVFPAVVSLVGEDFFGGMAREFIAAHPPSGGCLNLYGAGFPDFIDSFEPVAHLGYLADVARLDYAVNYGYYAINDTALRAQDLTHCTEEQLGELRLTCRDSVSCLASRFPIDAIRQFALSGDAPPDMTGTKDTYLLVSRPQLDVEVQAIDAAEYTFLRQLDTRNLGKAFDEVLTAYPDFAINEVLDKHFQWKTFLSL